MWLMKYMLTPSKVIHCHLQLLQKSYVNNTADWLYGFFFCIRPIPVPVPPPPTAFCFLFIRAIYTWRNSQWPVNIWDVGGNWSTLGSRRECTNSARKAAPVTLLSFIRLIYSRVPMMERSQQPWESHQEWTQAPDPWPFAKLTLQRVGNWSYHNHHSNPSLENNSHWTILGTVFLLLLDAKDNLSGIWRAKPFKEHTCLFFNIWLVDCWTQKISPQIQESKAIFVLVELTLTTIISNDKSVWDFTLGFTFHFQKKIKVCLI